MRNIRTFENFSSPEQDGPTEPLWALYGEYGELLGIYETKKRAKGEYEEKRYELAQDRWEEEYGDFDEFARTYEPDLEIRKIFPDNEDDVRDAFEATFTHNDRHLAKDLVLEYDMDPLVYFKHPKDLIKFFKGDIDWWDDAPESVKRAEKTWNLFRR